MRGTDFTTWTLSCLKVWWGAGDPNSLEVLDVVTIPIKMRQVGNVDDLIMLLVLTSYGSGIYPTKKNYDPSYNVNGWNGAPNIIKILYYTQNWPFLLKYYYLL